MTSPLPRFPLPWQPHVARPLLLSVLLAIAPVVIAPLGAAPLPTATPETVGLRAAPLARIKATMEQEIAAHHMAGVVTLVLRNGKVVHHEAAGYADREKQQPMAKDSVFWIASMTKSISATAVMILVDEGRLSLDEPASTWLPELAGVKLASGAPPARPITLRDLLSHTAGIAFPPRKATDGSQSLKNYAIALLTPPLAFEPGSAYEYNFGITIAGRIVEIVSGQRFEDFVATRILQPLGMNDSTFHPDDAMRSRFAKPYKTNEAGDDLEPGDNPFITSDATVRRMTEPSGGLFSTATDMARFYQMILNGGELGGHRIVSPQSVAEMTRPHHAGDKPLEYGLGWMTGDAARKNMAGFSPASYGHGGAFATHGLVDSEHKLVVVFMVQDVLVKNHLQAREAFHRQVVAALD